MLIFVHSMQRINQSGKHETCKIAAQVVKLNSTSIVVKKLEAGEKGVLTLFATYSLPRYPAWHKEFRKKQVDDTKTANREQINRQAHE